MQNVYNYVSNAGQTTRNMGEKVMTSSYLQSFLGRNVKINRGGPDSLQGNLTAIKSDFVVLSTKEGLVNVASSHVKSVTEMSGGKSGGATVLIDVAAGNFKELIRAYNQSFVQINWGGPEKVEGFIYQVTDDAVMLLKGKEFIQIPIYHIKTIKAAAKSDSNKSGGNANKSGGNVNKSSGNADKSDSNASKSEEKKQESKSANKSGSNKAGGKKTGGARSGGAKQ